MKVFFRLILLIGVAASVGSCCPTQDTAGDTPLLMLRFRGTTTETDEAWDKTFRILKENPGCCDEVWFSTGLGFPPLSIHREQADRMLRATQELKEIGVGASLQVQMTIGHGDALAVGEESRYSGLTWQRWTGSTGITDKYCSCPRQPEFLAYIRQMARIYADIHPHMVWIDDDLRFDNHAPATNGSHIGCWCETCIADFNAATGGEWTSATLAAALNDDAQLAETWREFCIASLTEVARVIAEEFREHSPETRLGLQGGMGSNDVITAILQTLHEVSGSEVGYRPGGGAYYDNINASEQIVKSMECAKFRKKMGDPDWIAEWCPEIESWPRVYGSRTPQGVLVEAFTALAYGMNSVSMFVMAAEKESDTVYSQSMLRPLAAGAPLLRAYAKANQGTVPAGYTANGSTSSLYAFACTAIPVLPGCGQDLGTLTASDLSRPHLTTEVSTRVQELRDELCQRHPAPVVCTSPFIGLLIPRIDEQGNVRTIGLQNVRIDAQGPIRLRIDSLPDDVRKVQWWEMRQKPVWLPVEREQHRAYITVPGLGVWNAGFIAIPYL